MLRGGCWRPARSYWISLSLLVNNEANLLKRTLELFEEVFNMGLRAISGQKERSNSAEGLFL